MLKTYLRKLHSAFNLQNKLFQRSFFPFCQKNHIINDNPDDSNSASLAENKLDESNYINVITGVYPYIPLDDHPLIPGYARMISVPKDLHLELRRKNVEKTNIVISISKNPENIEALQISS